MLRFRFFLAVLVPAIAACLCVSAQALAQEQEFPTAPEQGKPVPAAIPPVPFSADDAVAAPPLSVEFRPADRMTKSDILLVADAESAVAEHARLNGFSLEQGTWNYEQIVCPALPGHLFLRYMRNNGVGDVTEFSASIPRGSEGRVRIIPILRRSYSLFSPAPINALTISAFNHIRAEEPSGQSSNWVGNGLCYAALAGAHPQIMQLGVDSQDKESQPGLAARLVIPKEGGEVIKFDDAAAVPHPMEWTMTFTRKGRLTKATHVPAVLIKTNPVSQKSPFQKSRTVPQAAELK